MVTLSMCDASYLKGQCTFLKNKNLFKIDQ